MRGSLSAQLRYFWMAGRCSGFRAQGVSGEGARSGVKHPGRRACIACKPTPATQTVFYWVSGGDHHPALMAGCFEHTLCMQGALHGPNGKERGQLSQGPSRQGVAFGMQGPARVINQRSC